MGLRKTIYYLETRVRTPKRSITQSDARSFIELRYDLRNSLTAIVMLSGIELENLLIKEEMNANLRGIYISAVEASAALRIMFDGYEGTESEIQPYQAKEARVPSNQDKSGN
jgi:hypothetical protein